MAMLVLGGCAVGPDFRRPDITVTKEWVTKNAADLDTQAAVNRTWWRSFEDPVLDSFVDQAYHQNLPLQIAGLRIIEARAQLAIATGKQFPQQQSIIGSVAAIGIAQDAEAIPGLVHHFLGYQIGFDAVWELDFWGKYRRGVEAETAALLSSVADYQNGIVSLTAETARTYVAVRSYEMLLAQAHENVRVQEEALQIAEARYHAGATSELDVTQADTLLQSTLATIPQLQIGLEQSRHALATLLGQSAGTVEAQLASGRPTIPCPMGAAAIGVPAELLRRRADIRQAELLAASQCARIGVAKADLYPSFALAGTIGFAGTSPGGTAGVLNDLFYTLGPTVNWPFFNYGRLTNAVRVQDARFQQLLINYRYTVLRAAQEVEDASTGFAHSREVMVALQRAVISAQRSLEISLVMYREGAADYERVLDAQRALLENQNAWIQWTSSATTNLIALYKALGGGWESRQGEPVVNEATQREMSQRTSWGDLLYQPRPVELPRTPQPAKR
jgi:NodT family efflux transporter outer membrane factor (OMF) lipoprotein